MKFAFVSHSLPPSLTGQAMMIYRLLNGLHPSAYCLLSLENYDLDRHQNSYTPKLAAKYYYLPARFQIVRGYKFGLGKIREFLNVLIGIVSRTLQIARISKEEKCDAVIACTGDLIDLPASYLASKLVGLKFYPYVFDYYSYQWIDPMSRYLAKWLEPWLLRGATEIITHNEFLQDAMRLRYGIHSALIRNPCDLSEYEKSLSSPSSHRDNEISIVFTGHVYEAHFDAFRNLMAAIDSILSRDVKLHLFTNRSASSLAEKGIRGPVVCHEPLPLAAMPDIQRRADILFLPLSFNSPYPEVIKTSAPSKLGEYLASRRPILVHAPSDSFIAWYFRQHDCGLVVDDDDPGALARAIEAILDDVELQKRLCTNAWNHALREFSTQAAQIRFSEVMKLDPQMWASS